jgi:iron complex transport system substrate-binding protein
VRIVTTFPSVTETVFALGAGDQVVGVSVYCQYPPAVRALPKIGTYLNPDLEKIALLRPDLVIIEKSATSLAERLSALGIPHTGVKLDSLAEVYSTISDIGRAVGLPHRAEKLNAEIQSRLGKARSECAGKPRPTVLIIMGRTPGLLSNLIAVGPGAYLGELLEIAGGKNVLNDAAIAYPQISFETVIRLNPDVILDLSMMGESTILGEPTDPAKEQKLRGPWLTHHELAAVRNHEVFGLTSEVLVTPGPRVVDAVQMLQSRIRVRSTPINHRLEDRHR